MIIRICLSVAVSMLLFAGIASAQYPNEGGAGAQQFPIMNKIADKVIQKYEQSTCEQLWQQKSQPKPPMEERAVQMLRSDPQMRAAFINKIAAPIANRMFECGLLP